MYASLTAAGLNLFRTSAPVLSGFVSDSSTRLRVCRPARLGFCCGTIETSSPKNLVQFEATWMIRGDDRCAGCERFDGDRWEGFEERRQDERVGDRGVTGDQGRSRRVR